MCVTVARSEHWLTSSPASEPAIPGQEAAVVGPDQLQGVQLPTEQRYRCVQVRIGMGQFDDLDERATESPRVAEVPLIVILVRPPIPWAGR